VKIGEGNAVQGTVCEVRFSRDTATIRVQFGEDIVESVIPKAVADELGIKAGDPVTATFEVTPVNIKK
jgi:molybdopterin-binding protein